jgi:hypothetical protein
MTTASGKYLVIAANTVEACRRQRIFIEAALKKSGLSPARRAELEGALNLALMNEIAAEKPLDEEAAENKEQDDGESGDQQGSSGGSSGDGGKSGGDTRGEEEGRDEEEDMTNFELVELFLFLLEKDAPHPEPVPAPGHDILEPLAAATLLFNHNEKTARIDKTYTLEQENTPHSPGALLSSLEQHAATLGAVAMYLKVHPDAVTLFQNKFGYLPHGPLTTRRGRSIQRMRKALTATQLPQD